LRSSRFSGSLLLIGNVGDLVCPALFDPGEARRIAILPVTEGDDGPGKYPDMFRVADVMPLNKVDFDIERAVAYAREVNPTIEVPPVSARTGERMAAWLNWIDTMRESLCAGAFQ
jgi:hydrogenase nickel incorporation protein HypB